MKPSQILGIPPFSSPETARAAALRELGIPADSDPTAIRRAYWEKARTFHPDRVHQTPQIQTQWQRVQAAMEILREPPPGMDPQAAQLWRQYVDFAEPLSRGFVESLAQNLTQELEALRTPKTPDSAGTVPGAPSLVRSIAVDTAQAALGSSKQGLVGALGTLFARLRDEPYRR